MEKLSPKVTDEGAKSYGMRNRRTLIRRLRRHLLYHREGFKSSNPPININLQMFYLPTVLIFQVEKIKRKNC